MRGKLFFRRALFVFLIGFVLVSCGSSRSKHNLTPYKSKAIAVYYHDKYNGCKTASGTIFSNKEFTAAHKTLAFGTKLRVTNIQNNKSVDVVVTDRGPFTKGREIDLSKRAFNIIAADSAAGLLYVKIEILH